MIATTINNSINEKPFCFLFIFSPWSRGSKISLAPSGGVRRHNCTARTKLEQRVTVMAHRIIPASFKEIQTLFQPIRWAVRGLRVASRKM